MVVAFMVFIKELRRNGGKTVVSYLKYYKCKNVGVKKKFGGRWRFSAVAAVSPPFLRSSLINIIKATTIPKLTAVTHFLAEFLR